jgi:hypothetical protein
MLAEADSIRDGHEQARWSLSAARGACWVRLRSAALPLLMPTAVLVTGLVVVDRSPSDIANQVALGMLVAGSGLLALLNPYAWPLIALATGLAIPVSHASYLIAGIQLPYVSHPGGWPGVASLLFLLIPAAAGAAVGTASGRLVRRTMSH